MKVLKFGGTSVGSANAIRQVGAIIKAQSETQDLVIVVSAFGGVTDRLEDLCASASAGDKSYLNILSELSERHHGVYEQLLGAAENDFIASQTALLKEICDGVFLLKEITTKSTAYVMSYGERMSSYIISEYFKTLVDSQLFDSRDYLVVRSDRGETTIDTEASLGRLKTIQSLSRVNVFPGFIASNTEGITTTLGRGGSDLSAALLANFLKAKALEIWTDVSGILSADPGLVKQAKVIPHLSYEEAMELSHFGAKVIYPPSIQPALSQNIPIKIKNTFAPEDKGTWITGEWDEDKQLIRGISNIQNIALINLTGAGMVGIPSFAHRFFLAFSAKRINVILITQASSEHSICAAVSEAQLNDALKALKTAFEQDIIGGKISGIEVGKDLAILALVGSNMKNQVGVSGKMFHILGRNGISIKAIAQGSSERNISAVIPQANLKKAMNVLHEGFFLSDLKRINLFIIGVGNVGQAFLGQLRQQYDYLMQKHQTRIVLAGIANSKKMIIDEEGVSLDNWQSALRRGQDYKIPEFISAMIALNMRNSTFVDITGAEEVAAVYRQVLENSISVVTPSKIAATDKQEKYEGLINTAKRFNSHFLFETNVCAGLPIISTLNDLVRSGDQIHRIDAVLSGTLNFLFNTYDGSKPFVEVIKEAGALGFTEPDPRLDLFGEDVKRKILILARQSGYAMELEDVELHAFMPDSCHRAKDIESFYEEAAKQEPHFRKRYEEASSSRKRLRVVATFDARLANAKVDLQAVPEDHLLYHVEGMDNIVLFYTNRYARQPLVVKGAGAGAAVTASGIFADILKVSAD